MVALRKESVDRNTILTQTSTNIVRSLSARRAWIEMASVVLVLVVVWSSLSARRAWIEIGVMEFGPGEVFGRSPQGERG